MTAFDFDTSFSSCYSLSSQRVYEKIVLSLGFSGVGIRMSQWDGYLDLYIVVKLPNFAWFPQLCMIQTIQPIFNLIFFRPSAVVSAADTGGMQWPCLPHCRHLDSFAQVAGRVDLWNFRWIEMTFDRDTEWTLSPLSPCCSSNCFQTFVDFFSSHILSHIICPSRKGGKQGRKQARI